MYAHHVRQVTQTHEDDRCRSAHTIAAVVLILAIGLLETGCAALRGVRAPSPAPGTVTDAAVPSDEARGFAHFAQGVALLADDRVAEAEQSFLEASLLHPSAAAPLLKLGEVQARLGKLKEARESFSKAAEITPQSAVARRALAASYLRSGELAEAAVEMERAVAAEPDNLVNYTALAAIYEKQKRENEVLELYRRLVEAKVNEPKARLLLARALERAGRFEEAEVQFEKTLELAPMEIDFYRNMAAFEMGRGQPEVAIRVYQTAIQQMPLEPQGYVLLGQLYERLDRADDARTMYKQAVEVQPHEVASYLALGQLEEKQNDITEAVDAYAAGLEVQPENIILRYGLASAYVHARDPKAAIAEFTEIVKTAPQWIEPHYNLGILYGLTEDHMRARRHLRKAIALNPNLARAHRYLAGTYVKHGELEKGIQEYEKVLKMEATGGDSEALGILYLIQGNAQKGIESLEKRGGEDSVTLLRAVLLGACYDMLGNSEMKKRHWSNLPHADEAALEALTEVLYASGPKQVGPHLVPLCKRAAGERPDDPTWHIIIGTIQETMEDRDAAIAAYTKALAMDPDNALIHFRLGGLYEEKGDYDAAVEHLQACLALDPRNAKACNYLGYMLAEQGANLDEAKTLIERALDIEPKNGYYLDSLGWVYYQEKEMEKAIEFLQLAVRHLDHDDAVVRDHLGDAHFAAGGIEQAIIQWRKALRLDPDNETIKEKLQRHQPETEPADMIR